MKREWCATVGTEDHELTVEPAADGRWRVVVGGVEQVVDARELRPGSWSLIVDGRSWVVDLDHRKRGTVVLARGTETPIAVEDARRRRLAAAVTREGSGGAGGEVVRAPIAGKVVKVLVEAGAEVQAGQAVAVLEAMKMENEIKASQAGAIKEVHVTAGQSVETNEPLLTIG